jgi:DNA mismatch repair protein MutL
VSDVIQLLSDHLANQIAAGEVIQRPASAVKEMLENAIDAGATEVQLIVKDAGKELIQVIDNGSGMSVTDARMSFERHATSKIKSIDDLFTIRTMGFRGEALASIAAVAQVEMKTRQQTSDAGTRLVIESTEVKLQEPCAAPVGTSIAVKNLFYNVPARRNFLKSNTTEFRHIIDEFTRIALAHPPIAFRMWHNGLEQFHLEAGNLKTRIVGLLGNSYEKNLVPVEEETGILQIKGFIGKPEAATRTRGMQFFFVNNRFIRNAYLNHALVAGYEGLLEKESFPFYVLFLETDPARIDVNVHPTKQEVKFEDDKLMYAYLNAAVKHALARYNIAPSLDFSLNPEITHLSSVNIPATQQQNTTTEKGYLFNSFTQRNQAHFIDDRNSRQQWKQLYEIAQQQPEADHIQPSSASLYQQTETQPSNGKVMLLHENYLVSTIKSGFMFLHIRRAQERIWYERLQAEWNDGIVTSQRLLFPMSVELTPQDAGLLQEILPDLQRMGFDVEPFGNNSFVVHAAPAALRQGEEKSMLEEMLEQLKHESHQAKGNYGDKMIAQLAKKLSFYTGTLHQQEAQQTLVDELFACAQPEYTPRGKKVFYILRKEMLEQEFD